MAMMIVFSAGCKNEEVIFSGLEDVKMSISVTEYDFVRKVVCTDKSGTQVAFTVDADDVAFGSAGEYEVVYSSGKTKETIKVYIYGTPKIETNSVTVEYAAANDEAALSGSIVAKDTFGNVLPVQVKEPLSVNENGVLLPQQNVLVEAKDEVGNTVEKEISVTVNDVASDKQGELATETVDFARAYCTIESGESKLFSVYCEQTPLQEDFYVNKNGYVMLLPACIESLGVGEHTLYINFNDGHYTLPLSVTDNQDPEVRVEEDFATMNLLQFDSILKLKGAVRQEYSIQNLSFLYYIIKGAEKTQIFAGGSYEFVKSGEYSYEVEVYRNGAYVNTHIQTFQVKSAWGHYTQNFVNAENKYINNNYKNVQEDYKAFTDSANVTKNAYVYKINSVDTAATNKQYLEISLSLLKAAKKAGASKMLVEICTPTGGLAAYLRTNSSKLVDYKATGKAGQWTTISFDLQDVDNAERVFIDCFHENGKSIEVAVSILTFDIAFDYGVITATDCTNLITEKTLPVFVLSGLNMKAEYVQNVEINGQTTNAIKITCTDVWADNKGDKITVPQAFIEHLRELGKTSLTMSVYVNAGIYNYGVQDKTNPEFCDWFKQLAAPVAKTKTISLSDIKNGIELKPHSTTKEIDFYITEFHCQ